MEKDLFDYHIKETNRRLESIEQKLDVLMDGKVRSTQNSKIFITMISIVVSALVSVISAVIGRH